MTNGRPGEFSFSPHKRFLSTKQGHDHCAHQAWELFWSAENSNKLSTPICVICLSHRAIRRYQHLTLPALTSGLFIQLQTLGMFQRLPIEFGIITQILVSLSADFTRRD
jgi:hypothetical protein